MIVTAAMSWYDEPPAMLARAVTAAANIADRVVALDGSYVRFPGRPASSPEQAEAIRRAAEAAGMECLVLTPDRLWTGEGEKRTFLYQMAAIRSDWIAVVDADHVVVCDREPTRAIIESRPDVDVWSVDFYTAPNPDRPIEDSAAWPWHAANAGKIIPFAHLLRALPDIRVERFHWWHSALKDGERVWMQYGGNDYAVPDDRPVLPHVHLDNYRVEHRTLFKDRERVLRNRAYYEDIAQLVAHTGQENDRPDLPRPGGWT